MLKNRRALPPGLAAAIFAAGLALPASAQQLASSVEDLSRLSIDELANLQVTTVSRTAQPLSQAPAAVYVISHDEIIRSGATSLPEMLRLAPNLQVAQISANTYAITSRGFNGNAANKLLVLIDGRSIYTPLFGGVQWDLYDVLPENIDRIEVISGPAAAQWGANAVNGVINIITRNSADTQGGFVNIDAGNRLRRGSAQYGGKIGSNINYRAYLEGFGIPHGITTTGANAEDGWIKGQGGFRLDWTTGGDLVTLEGDLFAGTEDASPTAEQSISGGNIQATWQHQFDDGSSLQLLSYFDRNRRYVSGSGGFAINTYDLQLQHSFDWGPNAFVWGGEFRMYQDRFRFVGNVLYLPPARTQNLGNIFVQDTIALTSSVSAELGLKLESDPFTALEPLPSARLSWRPNDATLLWMAISRAIRAPTRFDTDLQDTFVPGVLVLTGNPNYQPETLNAYEIGVRAQPASALSFSVSAFYNVYDKIRSVEVLRSTPLPVIWTWGNLMKADIYGVEAWGNYGVTDWWRLSVGANLQHEDRRFKPGSSGLGGVSIAGDDPNHQVSLRSSMDLAPNITWDADLRWIGMLPNPQVPAYVELNSRLAWNITPSWQLSVTGLNLLHTHHLEYELAGATTGNEVDRSVYVEASWRF